MQKMLILASLNSMQSINVMRNVFMLNLANLKWGTVFLPNLQSVPNSPQYIYSCVFFLTGKSIYFLFMIL